MAGEGKVCHGTKCHNVELGRGDIRIELKQLHPNVPTFHPITHDPMEVGAFTFIPKDRITLKIVD